jgi:hypothetical protein
MDRTSLRPIGRGGVAGLVVVIAILAASGAAFGASKALYAGKTSQHQPISFAVSAKKLIHLSIRIEARCRRHRQYLLKLAGFTPVPIKHGTVDQHFKSKPARATFTLKGTVGRRKVTGSISIREFISREHRFCSGRATFVANRRH